MEYSAREMETAMLAVKSVAPPYNPVVERARDDDDFESGSRLSHVSDHPVAPRVLRCVAWIIRVIIREGRQRQDLARARTNHDSRDAVGRVLIHPLGQSRFNYVLHHRIDGQHHVQTVLGLHILFPQRDHLAPGTVYLCQPPAAHSG